MLQGSAFKVVRNINSCKTNDKVDGTTHVDRKLYSGDSPKACDQLGKIVAEALLDDTATGTLHPTADDGARGGAR